MSDLALGRWTHLRASGPFAVAGHAFAGTSGGRTSAMMTALLPATVTPLFCNTGREHPGTYAFVERLDEALGGRIVWLEFRPPARHADRPANFGFAVVDARTADRSGGPFESMLACLAAYRASKGKDPVAPWARSRICTAYMKNRVMDRYAESRLGDDAFDQCVGLRADEPDRVARIQERSTQRRAFRTPLHGAGITKADVLEFWSAQRFDLSIRENQGNCTSCFLKDHADISRVMGETETDRDWWLAIERKYPGFGGKRWFPGYAQLDRERPVRLAIERELRAGRQPRNDGSIEPRRFRLVVLNEARRLRGETPSFSCACENSYGATEDDDALDEASP